MVIVTAQTNVLSKQILHNAIYIYILNSSTVVNIRNYTLNIFKSRNTYLYICE